LATEKPLIRTAKDTIYIYSCCRHNLQLFILINNGALPQTPVTYLRGQISNQQRPPRRLFFNGLFQACPLNSKNSLRSDTFEFLTRSALNHP
jgi:hypothetical protein